MKLLEMAGAQAKWLLACGLVVAMAWPAAAQVLSSWLVPLIMLVMFLGALRLRPDDMRAVFSSAKSSLIAVLILQLLLPLSVALFFRVIDVTDTLLARAVVIALSASGIASSPNIATIMRLDGAVAMRLLGLGTALVPLTCILPLLVLVGPLDIAPILMSALRMAVILLLSAGLGILVRQRLLPHLESSGEAKIDGLSAIALSVFVIALMPAFSDTAANAPLTLVAWLSLAVVLNYGLQFLTDFLGRKAWPRGAAGSLAIIAGNRNMALFFAALPVAYTEPLLPYLAAYQIPMYLTPLLMAWFYRK